jgi:hypothetical protein
MSVTIAVSIPFSVARYMAVPQHGHAATGVWQADLAR